MKNIKLFFIFIVACFSAQLTFAHIYSTDYLNLSKNGNSLSGYWLINIQDIQSQINLDLNNDLQISWLELKQSKTQIESLLLSDQISFSSKEKCTMTIDNNYQLKNKTEGKFLSLKVDIVCPTIKEALTINTHLFLNQNPNHKTLLFMSNNSNNKNQSFIFDQAHQSQNIQLSENHAFMHFFKEGVIHILEGFDHLLFLVTLFLPIIFHSKESIKYKLFKIIQLMTLFSIAHSITLGLSWSGWISLPSRFTESIIALSVALAGLSFFHKKFNDQIPILTLIFGLIHGLGFASALTDLSLKTSDFFLTLFTFNLGIETGQLLVVFVTLPLFFFISRSQLGHRYAAPLLAIFVTLCGTGWMIERLTA